MPQQTSGDRAPAAGAELLVKVFGVGGAGASVAGRLNPAVMPGVEVHLLDTDKAALAAVALPGRHLLGASQLHGMGAGSDPAVAREAAEAELESLRALCRGAGMVFILAGLGGGTGTGVSPLLARVARESGALVLGLVTLPFAFQGERRRREAERGLQMLKHEADLVICFPNQEVQALVGQGVSLPDALHTAAGLLAEGVRGIWRLLTLPGLISLSLADLRAATAGLHSESVLAAVSGEGTQRGDQAWEQLLAHPLMQEGRVLDEADSVLVGLIGGMDLALDEVNTFMTRIQERCARARFHCGAVLDPAAGGRLSAVVIAARATQPELVQAPGATGAERPTPAPATEGEAEPAQRNRGRFVAPAPELSQEQARQLLKPAQGSRQRRRNRDALQTQLPLEIISRGRFENSEPTVVQGHNLDEPTFIRMGVKLN